MSIPIENISMKLHINTPLLKSEAISRKTGKQIFLKMESLQPAGSFKVRGMGFLCSKLAKEGAKSFVIASAGNAGLAVAYVGKELNIPVTVIVGDTVSEMIRNKLSLKGASVVIHGNDWFEANLLAQSMAQEPGVGFVHPFDHPLLWQGYASLIHEVEIAGAKPDCIVVAVGGGGLLCGIIQGLHEVGWSDVPVLTAETEGAASFLESVQAGQLVTLKKIETIATSLGARRISEQAFAWTRKHTVIPNIVSDVQAINAVLQFLDDQKTLVEPACGAALALAYMKNPLLMKYEKILIIVCGGCNISLELLEKWNQICRGDL
jgi:L-serine/L-threonine ammonia-lyase